MVTEKVLIVFNNERKSSFVLFKKKENLVVEVRGENIEY